MYNWYVINPRQHQVQKGKNMFLFFGSDEQLKYRVFVNPKYFLGEPV